MNQYPRKTFFLIANRQIQTENKTTMWPIQTIAWRYTKLLSICLPDIHLFSKIYYLYTKKDICNKKTHYRSHWYSKVLLHYVVK